MIFGIKNLVSKEAFPCVPWTFSGAIPLEVRGKSGKKERHAWMTRPATTHLAYSGFEGVNPNARVSESRASDEGNPPLKCHAIISDYDTSVTPEELQKGIERLGSLVPNYIEQTLSGNARLIWMLSTPVSFPNSRFAKEWLGIALANGKFDCVAPGFDKPAFLESNRYYTCSDSWCVYDEPARIPFDLANGWVVETAAKHIWRKDRGSVEIPLPEVLKELEKRWPTHGWGDFVEGSQGPTFWIEGSSSPTSAVLKTTGIFTFAAHAPKPFYSWADLVGIKFVQEYAAKMMGKAVEGIYHDGKSYYRKTGFGEWKSFAKEDIIGHLRVDRGLESNKDGAAPSQVDRAVQYVQNWQGIDGAAPFVFQPQGLLHRSGGTFLNTHTRKVVQPQSEKALWGKEGSFPWLSGYLDTLFDPREQLEFFLSWLARFYKGAYEYNLESGQNVFVLGPPGVGKTLLSQGVLPKLVGGGTDAEQYLLGNTGFNSQLFEVPLWTVDDNSANVDPATHRKFSSMVKKMAANTTFEYHAKFRIPCAVDWLGRVVVTANDDEESARIVPDLSLSLLDKLMLFRSARKPGIDFPARALLLQTIERELPGLARFLLDYETPGHCQGTARFGIKAYHEPSLLETAEQSSRSASFHEIVVDWAEGYFREKHDLLFWEGSAFQFLKTLHAENISSAGALRNLSMESVARNLMGLKAKGFEIESRSEKGTRVWKLHRPKKGHVALEAQPIGAKFSK